MSRKTKHSTPAPVWFPRLSAIAPYTTVQVSEKEIEGWLDDVAHALHTAEAVTEIEDRFRQLVAFKSRQINTLAETDWSQYGGHQLVWWSIADMTLQRALDVFLPPPYDQWPQSVRIWMYVLQLIVIGTAEAIRPQSEHADPLELACRAVHVRLAGPYAEREIQRRRAQHVGSPVGDLLLWRDLDQQENVPAPPLIAEAQGQAAAILDKLRACTWRQTYNRIENVVHDPGLVTQTLKTYLSSEIYETVVTRWGGLEGLDALARSLDGRFNITPKAVADRVMKPDRLTELFPFLEERATLRLPTGDGVILEPRGKNGLDYKPGHITLSITEEDSTHPAALSKEAKDIVQRFLKRNPKYKEGIELCLSEEPLKKLAAERGISVQTIINRKNRAQEALKQFEW